MPEFERLDASKNFYRKISRQFRREWLHKDKKAEIVSIYVIKHTKLARLTETRFHGTQRACNIGSRGKPLNPCDDPECYLCGILKNGFSIQHSAPHVMFGPGIYTSVVSSKADIYARNHRIRSHEHVLLICGVDLGTTTQLKVAGYPGSGYDSVEGLTKLEGGSLEYPETVVFNTNNIRPLGLVVYTREGWTPR